MEYPHGSCPTITLWACVVPGRHLGPESVIPSAGLRVNREATKLLHRILGVLVHCFTPTGTEKWSAADVGALQHCIVISLVLGQPNKSFALHNARLLPLAHNLIKARRLMGLGLVCSLSPSLLMTVLSLRALRRHVVLTLSLLPAIEQQSSLGVITTLDAVEKDGGHEPSWYSVKS